MAPPPRCDPRARPVSYLVLISDTLHNFIGGLVIAGAFLVDVQLGTVTTLAIAFHEIPQETGDFGILVCSGFDRRRALALNYLTQATVVFGGVVGCYLHSIIAGLPTFLLPFAAGNSVYIASSDLIPEIKDEASLFRSGLYVFVFLVGIGLVLGIRLFRGTLG
jgi:zinc and cadmium transporter